MLISSDAYKVFIFIVLGCAFLPYLYFYFKEKKRKIWYFLILLILVPIDMNTPSVVTVEACGEYKKQVLIFPTKGLTNGYQSYIINNSDTPLYLETIVYKEDSNTDPVIDERDLHSAFIAPKETYEWRMSQSPDYIFEDAPENVMVKEGKVSLRYRLSCDPFFPEEFDLGSLEEADIHPEEDVQVEVKDSVIED